MKSSNSSKNKIQLIFQFFRTIPKTLNWLVLFAFLLLILKVFVLNNIPQPFNGVGDFGLVFEGIFGSIIASYIFYLIVVHIKEISDRRIIYPYITRWTKGVVGHCKSQLSHIAKAAGVELSLESVTKEEIARAFKEVDPNSRAPLFLSSKSMNANWMQYFDFYKTHSKRSISKIMSQLLFLEAPLVGILTKIDNCAHFNIVEMLAKTPFKNRDMLNWAGAFFDYCVACRELNDYLKKRYEIYS